MNAILILLGMFSITFFISNLSFLKKVNAFSFFSIPLLLGILFSPEHGIMPILPSTLDALSWALKVALTWVTFLAGARLWQSQMSWQALKKLYPFFLGFIFFFCCTLLIIHTFEFTQISIFHLDSKSLKVYAVALILSAVLFSSKENPFLLTFFFISLLFLFTDTIFVFTILNLIFPLSIGILMGVVCRLIIPSKKQLDTPGRLTLAGVCILAAGWAAGMGDLEVLAGLSFGWAMAVMHNFRVFKDPKLVRTTIPVKFIISLFAGMFIELSASIVIIGLLLAVTRFALKALILNIGLRKATAEEILTTIIPISKLALPITLSLHLSKFSNEDTSFILSCFCVGFIANDLVALALEVVKRDKRSSKTAAEVVS